MYNRIYNQVSAHVPQALPRLLVSKYHQYYVARVLGKNEVIQYIRSVLLVIKIVFTFL